MASMHWPYFHLFNIAFWFSLFTLPTVYSYEVPIFDTDYSRQVCSGMWGGASTYINVSFDASSQGQVAMVVYEWADSQYLGKITDPTDVLIPKTYVCTSSAMSAGFCTRDQLGRFILDLPEGRSLDNSTFWLARVVLPGSAPSRTSADDSLWDSGNNPTPPASKYDSPWRRDFSESISTIQTRNPSPDGLYSYTEPIQYPVKKTGYYCVAVVPFSVKSGGTRRADTDISPHPSFTGSVLFKNTFDGQLPATDYPKVNFYFSMFIVYTLIAAMWGWLCYQHIHELLPIQYYLSGLVGLLVIEMVANWAYYRYLNAHGKSAASTIFLIVVAVLDAGRNSMSFFMLLVVSLGLSVVNESLGRTMLKCQGLAAAHFLFGILYAIGIVELELESTSALLLLLFIVPLAFTLSAFLLWIMYSLNATIVQLKSRKQRYKLRMFERLRHILIFTVLVIAAFFVVSSFSFSGRLAEDYAAKTWRVRWWLLDGWLALLYLVAFVAISFLWRPSANNRRYVMIFVMISIHRTDNRFVITLAMSDEIAQDEQDAEDYDLETMHGHGRLRDDDDDDATLVGGRRGGPDSMAEDNVVFEIGDEDEDEDESGNKIKRGNRVSGEDNDGHETERQGLIGNNARNRDD